MENGKAPAYWNKQHSSIYLWNSSIQLSNTPLMGHVALRVINGTFKLVIIHWIKSMQLIWRSGSSMEPLIFNRSLNKSTFAFAIHFRSSISAYRPLVSECLGYNYLDRFITGSSNGLFGSKSVLHQCESNSVSFNHNFEISYFTLMQSKISFGNVVILLRPQRALVW